ncbi:MAG TPA: GYF domain-containing protein [Fimbriimonas sp.]|nr:GYF domain-containing protein [Fimbriimonas sp.]
MRYFIHANDGQIYGPADIQALNQWIAEGRIIPTTLLQPEGSQSRIAASTVMGLIWTGGQTYQAYTPQKVRNSNTEFGTAWMCFLLSLLCGCVPSGANIAFGIGGVVLATMAYRNGRKWALVPLVLNLLLTCLLVANRAGAGPKFDVQEWMRQYVPSKNRPIEGL